MVGYSGEKKKPMEFQTQVQEELINKYTGHNHPLYIEETLLLITYCTGPSRTFHLTQSKVFTASEFLLTLSEGSKSVRIFKVPNFQWNFRLKFKKS